MERTQFASSIDSKVPERTQRNEEVGGPVRSKLREPTASRIDTKHVIHPISSIVGDRYEYVCFPREIKPDYPRREHTLRWLGGKNSSSHRNEDHRNRNQPPPPFHWVIQREGTKDSGKQELLSALTESISHQRWIDECFSIQDTDWRPRH
jgi:hypothetical protein